jgi:MtN3 and saliva related transmembrane protein
MAGYGSLALESGLDWASMAWVSVMGAAAGICTTAAYVPQVLKTWRSRSTSDISLVMFLVMVTGVALWLGYGIALKDWVIVGANAATLLLTGIVLFLKLRHG